MYSAGASKDAIKYLNRIQTKSWTKLHQGNFILASSIHFGCIMRNRGLVALEPYMIIIFSQSDFSCCSCLYGFWLFGPEILTLEGVPRFISSGGGSGITCPAVQTQSFPSDDMQQYRPNHLKILMEFIERENGKQHWRPGWWQWQPNTCHQKTAKTELEHEPYQSDSLNIAPWPASVDMFWSCITFTCCSNKNTPCHCLLTFFHQCLIQKRTHFLHTYDLQWV